MTEEKEYKVVENEGYIPKSFLEMALYKIDRTFAILGVIVLGGWALAIAGENFTDPIQLAIASVSGLVGYIGGRTVSK